MYMLVNVTFSMGPSRALSGVRRGADATSQGVSSANKKLDA